MTEVWSAVEECYEFMLAYAAKGLATDEDRGIGRQVRKMACG
jgi:hypothetical protein